jgi:hypothetical protein
VWANDAAPPAGAPGAAGARRRVGRRPEYTPLGYPAPTADPGSVALAAELAALADAELVEQARLLAELPPAMTMWVLPRLRLTLAELAHRLVEREAVQP